MSDVLVLFSSDLERDAACPEGVPSHVLSGTSGVGLVEAGIGTTRVLVEHKPDAVIFAGTCGAYRGGQLRVGDVLLVQEAVVTSGDVVRASMRLPTLMASRLKTSEELTRSLIGEALDPSLWELVKTGSVASTLGVTESDDLAMTLFDQHGCDAENLEAFAVVKAAGTLPCAIILGVTNIVGNGGGLDWAANYRTMMATVGEIAVAAARPNGGTRGGIL